MASAFNSSFLKLHFHHIKHSRREKEPMQHVKHTWAHRNRNHLWSLHGDCQACLLSWSQETTIESIQPKILTYSGKQTKDKFFDNDVRARLPSLQEIQKLSDRLNKKTAP